MEESIRLPAEWAGWRLTEWIGGGSYGDVYEAEFHQQDDFDPGRKAAIKIIRIPRDDAEAAVLAHEIPDPSARSRYLEDLAGHLLMEIRTMDLLRTTPMLLLIRIPMWITRKMASPGPSIFAWNC